MLELRGVAMLVIGFGAVILFVIFLVVVLVTVVVAAVTTVATVMSVSAFVLSTQYAAERLTVQFQVCL
jgi:hypothetical protein